MNSQSSETRRLKFSEEPPLIRSYKIKPEYGAYDADLRNERAAELTHIPPHSNPPLAASYASAGPSATRKTQPLEDRSQATVSLGLGLGLGDLRLDRNYSHSSKVATSRTSASAAYHSYLKYGKLDETNDTEEDYGEYFNASADNNHGWRERAGKKRVKARDKGSKPHHRAARPSRASEKPRSSMEDEYLDTDEESARITKEEHEAIVAAIKRGGQAGSP